MTEPLSEQQATTETVARSRRWLERLKINRFRSVEPGTELTFSDGLHVILGKNATGKSTLLDIVAAALDLNFDPRTFPGEPLDLELTLRAGPFSIEAAVKREILTEPSEHTTRKGVGPEPAIREEGRYAFRSASGLEVTVVLSTEDPPQRTVHGVDPIQYGLDAPLGRRHMTAPLAPRLTMLPNLWFDGSLRAYPALETLLGKDAFSIGKYDQALFRMPESDELFHTIEADDFEIGLGKSIKSRPNLLPDKIFSVLPNDGAPIQVLLNDEPLLSKFVQEMGFSEARMFLGPPRVESRLGFETFVYSSPAFTFYRNGRLVRRGDQLSYGQRRLFALGWYLVCNKDVAILDEPSNGLHESWIEFLVSQLRDRQVFLTSQNREMLDMLPFSSDVELSRGFVLCESRPRPDGGEPTLHWRGLRDEEAALMIKALRASRIDLVTDVLRALDLW